MNQALSFNISKKLPKFLGQFFFEINRISFLEIAIETHTMLLKKGSNSL